MNKIVEVEARDVYGTRKYYPHNHEASLFAEIAGTKTLTVPTIDRIQKLGFEIHEMYYPERPLPVGPHDRSWCG